MRPDRVVIGTESERAREVLRRLYRPLYLIEAPAACGFPAISAASPRDRFNLNVSSDCF
jgi:hypothetical protein